MDTAFRLTRNPYRNDKKKSVFFLSHHITFTKQLSILIGTRTYKVDHISVINYTFFVNVNKFPSCYNINGKELLMMCFILSQKCFW